MSEQKVSIWDSLPELEEETVEAPTESPGLSNSIWDTLDDQPPVTVRDTQSIWDREGTLVHDLPDVNSILAKYEDGISETDIRNDPELQELVYLSLEGRGRENPNLYNKSWGLATRLAGGSTVGNRMDNMRDVDFDEVLDTYMEWQRGLSGGHSVTLGNELSYVMSQSPEERAKLALGYTLFDNMQNVVTGDDVTWGEMAEGIWDYTSGAVWDPINLATLGIGKAVTAGASKSSMGLIKKMVAASAKEGMAGAALRAAPFVAPDVVFNVGTDVMEQTVKMTAGSQDEYRPEQTAVAAAGAIMVPAVMAGLKGTAKLRKSTYFKGSAFDTPELSTAKALKLSKEEAWDLLSKNVEKEKVGDAMGTVFSGSTERFGDISADRTDFKEWAQVRLGSKDADANLTRDDLSIVFFRQFWNGDPKNMGFMEALKDAGFRATPSMLSESGDATAMLSEAIAKFIPDDTMKKIVTDFEKASGEKLGFGYTSQEIADQFASRASNAGKTFNLISGLRKLSEIGLDDDAIARTLVGAEPVADDPKAMEFALSTYKRLLTSHLSTTGANLKGFQQLVQMNTLADMFSSVAYAMQSGIYKQLDNVDQAAVFSNKANASRRAVMRRIGAAISPDTEFEYVSQLFDTLPEKYSDYTQGKLFRDIAGDGGVRDSAETFNMGDNRFVQITEGVTKKTQELAMVRLQDDMTKRWAFGANFDRSIERQFGETAQEFMSNPENAFKIQSKEFQFALDEAIFRTLRETASVNWSLLPSKGGMRAAAEAVEYITNRTPAGFVVPFGSFLNTTLATMADMSGINLVRHTIKKATKRSLDYADGDFGELVGKAAAGWTAIGLAVPDAYQKVQQGFAWDQEVQDDGSVKEKTFIWPESVRDLGAQILAHAIVPKGDMSVEEMVATNQLDMNWDNVPDNLKWELARQSGGQAVRDLDDVFTGIQETFGEIADDPFNFQLYGEGLLSMIARPLQGVTRPLDPINTAVGMMTGGEMNPDRRQGAENLNNMFRYVEHLIPGTGDQPRRNDPLTGPRTGTDIGKQLFGNRTTSSPTVAQSMFNMAGMETWQATRWDGPPEIKNVMDGMASNIFEEEAVRKMKKHPDFKDLPQNTKESIIEDMKKKVKERVIDVLDSAKPSSLNSLRVLSGKSKKKTEDVMERLGYEETLEELFEQDRLDDIERINFFVENYEEFFEDFNR